MCIQKVRIKDVGYHRHSRYSYFNCGVCAACRQQNANSKVQKIASHHPDGDFIRYLVTLTYNNDSIPVCSKSDLEKFRNLVSSGIPTCSTARSTFLLPIYRGLDRKQVIGNILLDDFPVHEALDSIRTVTVNYNKKYPDKSVLHSDFFSVAFSKDIKLFFNRLRQNMFRGEGRRVPITYYYSPEYGPTTARFHAHFIIWFPKSLSESQVRSYIQKSWPYQAEHRFKKGVEIARSPEHYVASYVNCDASVSPLLLKYFPLRQSHSLHFGFSDDKFALSHILSQFEKGDFGFDSYTVSSDGNMKKDHFLFSKFLINRYFPKFKGFNRLSKDTLRSVLLDPESNLRFILQPRYDENRKCVTGFEPVYSYTSHSGVVYYRSSLVDVYGNTVDFHDKEIVYTINRINKCYELFKPLVSDRFQFADLVIDYIFARQRFLYSDACQSFDYDGCKQIYLFDNLSDLDLSCAPSLSEYISDSSSGHLDPNLNPINLRSHYLYLDQYNKNIKQRQLSVC